MPRPDHVPEQGDFVRILRDPRTGREQSGERPALVLAPRRFNEITGYAFVAPVTDTVRGWPFEVPIPPGGKLRGVVLVDQTKSIDFTARHVRLPGKAPGSLVEAVIKKIDAILHG